MLLILLLACAATSIPPCPAGFHADPARAAAARDRLAQWGEVLAADLAVCWGDLEVSTVSEDRIARMNQRLGTDEAAARLAHLAAHGTPPPPAAPCEAWVADRIASEAWAMTVELELRERADLSAPVQRFTFEADFRAQPEDRRTAWLEAWLWAHPNGAAWVDPVVTAYRARCRAAIAAP